MSCVGMCSGVPRKRVRGDMITRLGKWISPIWIGSNKETMKVVPQRSVLLGWTCWDIKYGAWFSIPVA